MAPEKSSLAGKRYCCMEMLDISSVEEEGREGGREGGKQMIMLSC